jgi:hypothetical protein
MVATGFAPIRGNFDPAIFANPAVEPATSVIMGDIARVESRHVDLKVHVIGSAPIERLEIFDGLDRIETMRPYRTEELGRRIRVIFEGAEQRGRSRATVWDGELSLDGNQILSAGMINVWNREQGITRQTPMAIAWRGVTTGNLAALDLWLGDPNRGTLSIVTRPARLAIPVSDIGLEDVEVAAGGLERRIRLVRLPDRLEKSNLTLTRRISLRDREDTRLFVKVTQIDGIKHGQARSIYSGTPSENAVSGRSTRVECSVQKLSKIGAVLARISTFSLCS